MTAMLDATTPQGDLRVRGLTKAYGDVIAVNDVSFDLAPGQFFALLGPSGCGKTTVLKLLAGFEDPTAGEIHLNGRSMTEVPAYHRPLNTVFQQYALFPHMNVAKNVGFALRQRRPRMTRSTVVSQVNDALRLVQLDHLATRRIWELSGGQQQRVALARALVASPSILLLDEPLSALDARLRIDMQAELKSLQDQLGISFVFVTHDQSEALSMADRIAVLREGRLVQDSTPYDLYDLPADSWVANFIGSTNLLPGVLRRGGNGLTEVIRPDGSVLRGALTTEGVADGTAVSLAIRPERIVLNTVDSATDFLRSSGRVTQITFHGDQIDYLIATDRLGGVKARVPLADSSAQARHTIGAEVSISWRSQDARIVTNWNSSD